MKYLWLIAPCLLVVCAPIFNRVEPTLFGFPFFYWFQLLLVPVSAICIYFADQLRRG